jgi:hypothetical protein
MIDWLLSIADFTVRCFIVSFFAVAIVKGIYIAIKGGE